MHDVYWANHAVLQHIQVIEQVEMLKHHSNPRSVLGQIEPFAAHTFSFKINFPGSLGFKLVDAPQQR